LRVGVEIVVLVDAGFYSSRNARARYTERTDAELYILLDLLDSSIKVLDKVVTVFASPITSAQPATSLQVSTPACTVGKIDLFLVAVINRVRVKVVIEVDSVDVVAFHNIEDNGQRMLLNNFLTGVHPLVSVIGLNALRVGHANMRVAAWAHLGWVVGPVRIEPTMQFNAERMAFFDRKINWIPFRIWGAPLTPS
jgi:hypothetical protein